MDEVRENTIMVSIDGEDPFIINDNFEEMLRGFLVHLEELSLAK